MIFNMTGGGGDVALNFKIVAYRTKEALLAAEPSENTIGVVTTFYGEVPETKISSYILSPSEPAVPTPGLLWIAIGTSSNITFNAVKKNAIQVCPVFAKQYDGSEWVEVEAMSYVNGWIPWVTYLYNKGDEFMDLTGGWKEYNYKTSSSGSDRGTPTVTKTTDTIKVSLGDLKAGALFTEKAIDLTNISVLSIDVLEVTGGDLPFLVVSKTKANNYEVTEDDRVQIRKAGTTTLDVSKHQGPYYVVVSLQGSGSKSVTFSSINTRGATGSSSGTGSTQITLETKLVTPTKEGFDVTPTTGMALSKVTVEPIPDQYQDVSIVTAHEDHVLDGYQIVDNTGALVEGTIPLRSSDDIAANGATVTVPAGYYESAASKTIDDAGGSDIVLEPITVTPDKSTQEFVAEDGQAFSMVTVEPIPDAYQDVSGVTAGKSQVLEGYYFVNKSGVRLSGSIPVKSTDDITVSGTSMTVPAGYYDVAVRKTALIEVDSLSELHYWGKYNPAGVIETEKESQYISYYNPSSTSGDYVWDTVEYADRYKIPNGAIVLVNPQSMTVSHDSDNTVLLGKYIHTGYNDCFYYIPESASVTNYTPKYGTSKYVIASTAILLEYSGSDVLDSFVVSADSSTYPENGEQDGFNYVYQGTLSDTEKAAVIQALTITENGTYTAPSGVDGYSPITVNVASEEVPSVEQATPSISVSAGGLITASATQEAGQVAAGTKSATKQLTTQAAQTITPGTSSRTIAAGTYCSGTQTIQGDGNLKAENIVKGVSIFGVTGSHECEAGDGYVCKVITGTAGQTVFETGLSSIVRFELRKPRYDEIGLISASYPYSDIGDDNVLLIACTSYTTISKAISVDNTSTANYFTIDGGTLTWEGTSRYALAYGKTYYTLVAWGKE